MKCAKIIQKLNILILFITAVLFFLLSVKAEAIVSGDCVNCHTMHNSQGGSAVAYQINSGKTGYDTDSSPNQFLLMTDCVGCHSSTGTATIDTDNTPIVFNTSSFSDPLAGGNFSYVRSDDLKGHNVVGINGVDAEPNMGMTPPGGTTMSSQLTCAGEFGCHGNRSLSTDNAAMEGAHHTDDTGGITGASVGLSYRFLNGIKGTEDDDWEQDNINTSHNEYQGSTSNSTYTISYLCSRCHGDFHAWTGGASEVGTATPWLRHPTDVALPSTSEYASYQTYSTTAPVARPDLAGISDAAAVDTGDVVMCLSCHRAHSSPYHKILRWDIKGSLLEALAGCNVCHTSKD